MYVYYILYLIVCVHTASTFLVYIFIFVYLFYHPRFYAYITMHTSIYKFPTRNSMTHRN